MNLRYHIYIISSTCVSIFNSKTLLTLDDLTKHFGGWGVWNLRQERLAFITTLAYIYEKRNVSIVTSYISVFRQFTHHFPQQIKSCL